MPIRVLSIAYGVAARVSLLRLIFQAAKTPQPAFAARLSSVIDAFRRQPPYYLSRSDTLPYRLLQDYA